MTGELPPQPERDTTPEYELFNLDAMTDEQVILTGRAYLGESDRLSECGDAESVSVAEDMADRLGTDLGRLALRNPERARGVITRLATAEVGDEHRVDRELAALWVPQLIAIDYEFTKRILLALQETDVMDMAILVVQDLIGRSTPDQAADLEEAMRRLYD